MYFLLMEIPSNCKLIIFQSLKLLTNIVIEKKCHPPKHEI